MELNQMARMGGSAKKIGFKALATLIEFQQLMTQGMWTTTDPMLQLPGMDADVIKRYRQKIGLNKIPNAKIDTFCRLTPQKRKELKIFEGADADAKYAELEKVIKAMPIISVTAEAFTEGE